MRSILFFVAAALSISASAAATLKPCSLVYLTADPTGKADTATTKPIACKPGNLATCKGINPQCMFSLKTYSYICCFDLIPATIKTVATLADMSTYTTPATYATPRSFKPICPNGAIGFGGSGALTCNTSSANAGCPTGYSCVKAANIYDLYYLTNNPKDDVGAANTPQVCCKTSSIQSYSTVFTDKGLVPSIVPTAPLAGIAAVQLAGTGPPAKAIIYLGDDYSSLPKQLDSIPTQLTLFTATEAATANTRYHVLFFDATNNKECFLSANNKGTGTATLKFATPKPPTAFANPYVGTAGDGAVVYNAAASATATPIYTYKDAYVAPTLNTAGHLFVVLVFATPKDALFVAAGVKDSNAINANAGLNGDFEPGRVAGSEGAFTTVTALLSGKLNRILGAPIAGTYFTLKE